LKVKDLQAIAGVQRRLEGPEGTERRVLKTASAVARQIKWEVGIDPVEGGSLCEPIKAGKTSGGKRKRKNYTEK